MNPTSTKCNKFFHRLTNGGKYIPEIDGLRFVAIASVVAFHLYGQLVRYYGFQVSSIPARLLGNGERGVKLFFVISGFILGLPFASLWLRAAPAPNLKHYFLRRLTRLEPPYFLNLILCAVLLATVNHVAIPRILPHLLASLFYSHNFFYGGMSSINPVAWSLEVEVQFYTLMPLLAFVFAIRNPWARRIVLASAMLISVLSRPYWATSIRSHLSIAFYLQFFLAGLLLADLHLTRTEGDKHWWWDALSVIGWPMIFFLEGTFLELLLPFIALLLYWASFHGPVMNRFFRLPFITGVGGMCYTIYLFHFLLIAFATRILGPGAPPLLLVAVSLVLIAMVSSLYFLLVERPCMDRDWPRKLAALVMSSRSQPEARTSPEKSATHSLPEDSLSIPEHS